VCKVPKVINVQDAKTRKSGNPRLLRPNPEAEGRVAQVCAPKSRGANLGHQALILTQHERLLCTHEQLTTTREQLLSRETEVEHLKLLIAKLQRIQFGRKSEKLQRQIEQLELRLEELEANHEATSPPRGKRQRGRNRFCRCRQFVFTQTMAAWVHVCTLKEAIGSTPGSSGTWSPK